LGRWIAVLLVIVGASSYGLLSSFIKLAYDRGFNDGHITPAQMILGTLLVWLLIAFHKPSWKNPFRGPWIKLGLIGIFGLALTTIFYNIALGELNASLSIVLLFQFTWMTILMDCLASKRWPRKAEVAAIALILIGTLLAVNLVEADWSQFSVKGLVFGLLSGFTYSLFLFLTGQVRSDLPPLMKSAVMLTAAIPVLFVLYPPTVFVGAGSGELLLWGLLLGLLGQVVPTISFNIGIPRIGSALAAMLGSVELPVAVLAAYLIVHEPVNGWQWLGMLCILGGILISENKS